MKFSHKGPTPIRGSEISFVDAEPVQHIKQSTIALTKAGSLKAQVPDNEVFLQAGDVIFFGPDANVRFSEKHNARVAFITVDSDFFVGSLYWLWPDVFRDHVEAHSFFADSLQTHLRHTRTTRDVQTQLGSIVDDICAFSADAASLRVKCQIQSRWSALLAIIFPLFVEEPLRHWQRAAEGNHDVAGIDFSGVDADDASEPAIKAKRLLEGAIDQDWPLELLARQVHLSSRQIARIFKEAFGLTPTDYLTSLRVHAMAQLLRETNFTVAKVAQRVGWESRAQASSAFVKHFGITPGAYRAQAKKGLTVI